MPDVGAVRGRPDLPAATSRRTRSSRRPACAAALATSLRRRPPLVSGGAEAVDVFDAKADALAAAGRARRVRSTSAADRARRPGLVPSRPLRHASRSARRTCSAPSASCIRALLEALDAEGRWSRSRSSSSACPTPKAQGRRAPSRCSTCRDVPAGDARLRLRGRPRGEGRRHRARRAGRRPQARSPASACSTSTRARASRPGKKSVAIAVTLQPREKTMTDAEIDAVGERSSPRWRSAPAACCGLNRSVARGEHAADAVR